jgi:hypothetical protein
MSSTPSELFAFEEPDEPDESGEHDEHEPPGRLNVTRIRNILLIALAVVLIVVGVLFGPTALSVFTQRHTTLATPDDVGGLQRATSDEAQSTAEYTRDAIAGAVGLSKSVGLVFTDRSLGQSDTKNSVIFAGATGRVWSPGNALDRAFAVIVDGTGGVKDVHQLDGGDLGGLIKCGTTSVDGTMLVVCGWADHGSVGVALFANRTVTAAGDFFVKLRSSVEHR